MNIFFASTVAITKKLDFESVIRVMVENDKSFIEFISNCITSVSKLNGRKTEWRIIG
jgi:hypothetical protein